VEQWGPETYGDRIAPVYDELYESMFDVAGTVETLARLAGGGRALELAIGTGRIAIPLSAAGVEVTGIDASQAMVARLRAKPGGGDIPVVMGNFADVGVEGEFSLAYVVFNTLFALTKQEEQVRCFANVAHHLTSLGVFVVEAFMPDLSRFDRHQRVQVTDLGLENVMLETTRHDPVAQRIDSHHVVLGRERTELYPITMRYAYPPELDLMARLAGLHLRARWGGWRGEPFTSDSQSHVSVYERGSPPSA
jgi:SAM-dependent methyltransferase